MSKVIAICLYAVGEQLSQCLLCKTFRLVSDNVVSTNSGEFGVVDKCNGL